MNPSQARPDAVHVKFEVSGTFSVEAAVALGEHLRKIGLKLRYDDVVVDGQAQPKAEKKEG